MKLIANNVPYHITGDATGKIAARTWEEAKEPYADHIIDMITDMYAFPISRASFSNGWCIRRWIWKGSFPAPSGARSVTGRFSLTRWGLCVRSRNWPITGLRFQTCTSAVRAATRELEYRWRRDATPLRSFWPT